MRIRPYARVVIEGMDGSGKSTLTSQLMEYLGDRGIFVPGYNRFPEPKPPMPQWWMEQLGQNPVKVVVHDRFFYPEFVYGPILRGSIQGGQETIQYVQSFLQTHAFLIYCRPPTEVLMKGIEAEVQMEGVKNMFDDLLLAYDRLMIEEAPNYHGRFIAYDWSREDAFTKLVQRLASYIYQ